MKAFIESDGMGCGMNLLRFILVPMFKKMAGEIPVHRLGGQGCGFYKINGGHQAPQVS